MRLCQAIGAAVLYVVGTIGLYGCTGPQSESTPQGAESELPSTELVKPEPKRLSGTLPRDAYVEIKIDRADILYFSVQTDTSITTFWNTMKGRGRTLRDLLKEGASAGLEEKLPDAFDRNEWNVVSVDGDTLAEPITVKQDSHTSLY